MAGKLFSCAFVGGLARQGGFGRSRGQQALFRRYGFRRFCSRHCARSWFWMGVSTAVPRSLVGFPRSSPEFGFQCTELHGVPRSCPSSPELPGVARSCTELPGVAIDKRLEILIRTRASAQSGPVRPGPPAEKRKTPKGTCVGPRRWPEGPCRLPMGWYL